MELDVSKLDMIPYGMRDGTRICCEKVIICRRAARRRGISIICKTNNRESRDRRRGHSGSSKDHILPLEVGCMMKTT